MNIIMHIVIIIYILFILNIYIIIEIFNYEIKKIERNLNNKLVSISNHEPELVNISNHEPELVNISNHEPELVNISNHEPELVNISNHEPEPEYDNIYGCINIAQNNYAIDSYFIKNINNTNNFNSILSSLKDELNTCYILYNNTLIINTLINSQHYESYKQIKDFPLSKCDEEYFDYYIYNIYSGEICNELNILNNDCSQFNIITLMLGLERCNI